MERLTLKDFIESVHKMILQDIILAQLKNAFERIDVLERERATVPVAVPAPAPAPSTTLLESRIAKLEMNLAKMEMNLKAIESATALKVEAQMLKKLNKKLDDLKIWVTHEIQAVPAPPPKHEPILVAIGSVVPEEEAITPTADPECI